MRLVAALLVLTAVRPASGAGFFLADRGAAALARGGAYTVGAADLNAAWFNPSLVGRDADGLLTYLDLGLIHQSVTHRREMDPQFADVYPDCCGSVSNEAFVLPDPSLMVGWAQPGGRWAAALSVYAPYGAMPRYPEDGPQRYAVTSLESIIVHTQATVSYALSPDLRVGAGFQLSHVLLKQRMTISTYPGFLAAPEDAEFDSRIELDVADWAIPGGVVGVWYRPHDNLELGASWQTPLHAEAEGDLRVEIASAYLFSTTFIEGSRVKLRTSLPMIGRIGVRVVEQDAWDAELNVVWEDWSTHDAIRISPQETIRFRSVFGLGDYYVDEFTVVEDFEDTISVRLGGSYRLPRAWVDGARLSGGAFWETGAVPGHTLTVNLVDSDKIGLGGGASFDLASGVRLDLAYGHVFMASRDIGDSQRRQVNTLYQEGAPVAEGGRSLVGLGHYESAFDTVAISLAGEFL